MEKVKVWKKCPYFVRVVHNLKIPYDFLAAPGRAAAEPGREEKVKVWKKCPYFVRVVHNQKNDRRPC